MLREKRGAEVLGMEISQVEIAKCIANGVPVIQSDLDDDLDFAEDGSFDLVILSQTLQQMRRPDRLLRRLVRVGKRGAVSFINFGHFHCRWQLMLAGSMPRTTQIPYQWYNTPNIHLGTIRDFRAALQTPRNPDRAGDSDRLFLSAADRRLAEFVRGRLRLRDRTRPISGLPVIFRILREKLKNIAVFPLVFPSFRVILKRRETMDGHS